MTWSLNAYGHCDTKEAEAAVIETLSAAMKEVKAEGVTTGTQHHGTVNLLSDDPTGSNKK